ncbi:MAG: MFS transporter, partial [Pusillimonas sp.]|nr:MFS transporter [Pusillimonas sp.]
MFYSLRHPGVMTVTLAAAGIIMVTMGIRQTFGLFVSPINSSTGMGVATISLALAIGQFTWGAVQPIAGAVADRYGSQRVLVAGTLILAAGCAITPFMNGGFGLTVALGLLVSIGSGIGSFSVLLGAATNRLPVESRGAASGVINAGGSFGQFVFAPVAQKLIQTVGWMGALWAMALMALATLPLIGRLSGKNIKQPVAAASGEQRMGHALRAAAQDRSYWLLHIGFFTCGFHIAFLVTHLPGEVALCGLPPSVAGWSLAIIGLTNIVGSIYAGNCISKYRSKYILAAMYGSRALLIMWYLMMPRTEW